MFKKVLIILGALTACALLFFLVHSNLGFDPNYTVGVIKSSTEEFDSAISYYDENLNLLFTHKLFFCKLTNNGRCFTDLGSKKYTLSGGTYWVGCPDAIELDSNTGKIKKHYADANCSLAITANNRYVVTTYSAKDAHIHRCDKKTSELKKMTISGTCGGMYLDDEDVLYAFSGDPYEKISNLYMIDADKMEVLRKFNIRDKGCYQEECMKIGDNLYFLNKVRYYDEREECKTLTEFNTKTYEFKDIDLGMVPHKMVKFKDSIYISSLDDSADDILVMYNTKTGEIKKSKIEEKSAYCYMAVDEKNKKLYTVDGFCLYKYDLPSLKLIKSVDCFGKDKKQYYACVVFAK